ncbi:hypothetical protein CNMCM5623_006690 [Aspergillus felis]|uniref:HNH nuclease domain-containing protein n=1 Tax=Aspergillus felis TaxID=1287682 RepID=A0A8H6V1K1_9EURO|nr:hypothetical protein CNMCM5623_006690 [Aspergillus felis]
MEDAVEMEMLVESALSMSPLSPVPSALEDPAADKTTPKEESSIPFKMEKLDDPVISTLRAISKSSDRGDSAADERISKEKLARYTPRDSKDYTVEILTSFIENLPSVSKRVITKVITISGDDDLYNLAYHLRTAILIPMKAQGGKTAQATALPLSETDITRDNVTSEMTESSSRDDQEWLKIICLERDNYQCVVTKLWDPVAEPIFKLQEQGGMTLNTQLAHIIPFSLGHSDNDWKAKEIAKCWETLYLLFPSIKDVIKPTTINIPANAMTLAAPIHKDFGSLRIAFVPTDTENTYEIKMYPRHQTFFDQYYKKLVTFTKQSDSELPSRALLETHAAIAEILHASGQGKQIDELLYDWDTLRCLASDGSTDLQSLLSLVHVH